MHSLINVSENITYSINFFVNQATNLKLLKSPWKLGFKGALHSYLFLTFNCGSFCEHLLFVFEFKTITVKVCKSYHIFLADFKFLRKSKMFWDKVLQFLVSINLSSGHVCCLRNVGPYRFSRVDVYWIQTNRNQAK